VLSLFSEIAGCGMAGRARKSAASLQPIRPRCSLAQQAGPLRQAGGRTIDHAPGWQHQTAAPSAAGSSAEVSVTLAVLLADSRR
jgi:hypothetical protein